MGKKRKEKQTRKAAGKHALIHVTEDRNQYLIPNIQRVSETTKNGWKKQGKSKKKKKTEKEEEKKREKKILIAREN